MLSYAFKALKQNGFENIAVEKFENIHNLMAAILAKGIGIQLKQGLYREYIDRKNNVVGVRGKIHLQGTIKNLVNQQRMICCEYDELSENNIMNGILKTTAMLLLKHPDVERKYKNELKREMMFFSGVSDIAPTVAQQAELCFHRQNATYRMLIGLCRIILKGMLLTTDSGEYKLASFINQREMSRLYEKFILEYYKKECPFVKASASHITWALDDETDDFLPEMQSDITLTHGNKVLIIDAKFYSEITKKHFKKLIVPPANLYQIFAYVKNKAASFGDVAHKVSGMLLYAATNEEILPNQDYHMSGNLIGVRTLDLNREFAEIAATLDAIVLKAFMQDIS